jgi:hypothetical protein
MRGCTGFWLRLSRRKAWFPRNATCSRDAAQACQRGNAAEVTYSRASPDSPTAVGGKSGGRNGGRKAKRAAKARSSKELAEGAGFEPAVGC